MAGAWWTSLVRGKLKAHQTWLGHGPYFRFETPTGVSIEVQIGPRVSDLSFSNQDLKRGFGGVTMNAKRSRVFLFSRTAILSWRLAWPRHGPSSQARHLRAPTRRRRFSHSGSKSSRARAKAAGFWFKLPRCHFGTFM